MENKIGVILYGKNDNYTVNYNKKVIFSINSFLEEFDEVVYVDWNSPKQSLIYELADFIPKTGKIHHIVVDAPSLNEIALSSPCPKEIIVSTISGPLAVNIGLRRAKSDWIVISNPDIIGTKPDLSKLDDNTLYTTSRRYVPQLIWGDYTLLESSKLKTFLIENRDNFRRAPDSVSEDGQPIWYDKGDVWSMVVSCGDYQIARKSLWHNIKGYEEKFYLRTYTDTNVMKKSVLIGGHVGKIDIPAFHLDEERDSSKDVHNSYDECVYNFTQTYNSDDWGASAVPLFEEWI